MKILSIDAWAEAEGGWSWNDWFKVGDITKEEFKSIDTTRKTLKWFRDNGYTSKGSVGKLEVDDDGYNVVICERGNMRPLFAIEYGPEYN